MISIFDVPKQIRLWFSSDGVSDELDKMNQWLGLADENATVITDLLSKLEIKDISIDKFYDELKTRLLPLVGEDKTQLAIQNVNGKMLNPIKNDLISFGIIPPETTYRPLESADQQEQTTQPATEQHAVENTPALRPSFEHEPEPYILHRETPKETPTPIAPSQPPSDAASKAQLFSPRFGETDKGKNQAPGETRVVNYSQFRTPVTEPDKSGDSTKEGLLKPSIHPQNIVNLKRGGDSDTGQPAVNKENTINLKDLPVD